MKRFLRSPVHFPLVAGALSCLVISCKKPAPPVGPPPAAPRLTTQQISDNPSALLRSLADSSIQWKQFTPATVQYAKEANKLLLIFVSSDTQQSSKKIFHDIASDAETARAINEQFVPVLIDAESSREMGILATMLCTEIRKPISFPFMMWTTPEGHPVTWLPMGGDVTRDLTLARFQQAQAVVSRMWQDEHDYMKQNSATDNEVRRQRVLPAAVKTTLPSENQAFFATTLRGTHALFDNLTGGIENMGTLLPTSMQELYAASASAPSLTAQVRKDSAACVKGHTEMLLKSAAIDFLDGGFYSSRTDKEWNTVATDRNSLLQARAIRSFAVMSQVTKDPALLAVAERAMKFQEKHFVLADGTVAISAKITLLPNQAYYWSEQELEAALTKPEYQLLQAICQPSALGNVASESDPRRLLFRLNSLTERVPFATACATLQVPESEAQARLDSLREKLRAARDKKLPEQDMPKVGHAQSTLLTAAAYAALFTASGQDSYKEKALATMKAFRQSFHASEIMQSYPQSAYPATTDARAGLLANAAQVALDLYDITLDDWWLTYTDQLFAMLIKDHLIEGWLEETPPSSRFINLPIYDRSMIFDQSTSGMMKQNVARVLLLDRKVDEKLLSACLLSHQEINVSPVIHTDYLLGLLYQHNYTIVTAPADAPEALRRALALVPTRVAARKVVAAGSTPSGLLISRPGQPDLTITTPDELSALFTP